MSQTVVQNFGLPTPSKCDAEEVVEDVRSGRKGLLMGSIQSNPESFSGLVKLVSYPDYGRLVMLAYLPKMTIAVELRSHQLTKHYNQVADHLDPYTELLIEHLGTFLDQTIAAIDAKSSEHAPPLCLSEHRISAPADCAPKAA